MGRLRGTAARGARSLGMLAAAAVWAVLAPVATASAGIDVTLKASPVGMRLVDRGGMLLADIDGVSGPAYLTLTSAGTTVRLDGPYRADGRRLAQRTDALGATVDVSFQATETLDVTVALTAAPSGDRGWGLALRVPLDAARWTWAPGPNTALAFTSAAADPLDASLYPLTAIVNGRDGVALATPLDAPASSRFFRDGDELVWAFAVGTSALTRPVAHRVVVRMRLWRIVPRWAFRRALAEVYAQYPDRFARRHERVGLWSVATPQGIIDPTPFVFHEHGDIFFASTDSSGRPVTTQLPLDDRYGWWLFPYVHVGQMSRTRLERLPVDRAEIDPYLATQPLSFPPQALQRYTDLGFRPSVYDAALRASRIEGPDGLPVARIRRTRTNAYDPETGRLVRRWETIGNQVSFHVNPAPGLVDGAAGHGRRMLAWAAALLEAYPAVAGVYVDSVIGWAQPGNYRRSHFPFTALPLASDADGRAYLPNAWGHYEFLQALRTLLESRGKLLFANGYRLRAQDVSTFFHGTLPHVLGTENVEDETANYLARAMAGPRLILSNTQATDTAADVARHVRATLALGILPSARASYFARPSWVNRDEQFATNKGWPRYAEDLAEWALVSRLVEPLGRGEWHPIPHATSADGGVRIERFRNARDVFWTVYRTAVGGADVVLEVDGRLALAPAAEELVSGAVLTVEDTGATLRVTVPGVAAVGDLAVVRMTARDPGRAMVSISATDATATEAGPTTATVEIRRRGGLTTAPLTIALTVDGSAGPGFDYVELPREVTIPAGATTATVVVRPLADGRAERPESVIVTLAPGPGYVVVSPREAIVTIVSEP